MKGEFDTFKFFCPFWIVFAYDYHFFTFEETLKAKRGESHDVGVTFVICSIEFLMVDIIKATDGECQQKSVWLFVHVLKIK